MKRLSRKHKILFAIGGLGENVTFQAATAWIFYFWAGQGDPTKALLPLSLLGLLLGVGRFIEAFDDPLIGYLSDKTKSRWGRRFPYIFFGAPLLALSFILLWTPLKDSMTMQAIYFFLALQFFFLTYTLVSAPYEGILPEIAETSQDRVSASAWRVLFGTIGAGFGLIGSSLIIQKFGFVAMGIILGVLAWTSFWITALGIKDKLTQTPPAAAAFNFYQAIISTLKNRQFMVFSISLILFSLGFNLLTAVLPFYVKVILQKEEGLVAIFSGLVLGSMLTMLPIQTFLSSKKGKKWTFSYSMLILGLMFPLLAFIGLIPILDTFWQAVILVILIGLPLSGQFAFPNAILADIIDYDAKLTGFRREAIYYGTQNTLIKLAFALSSLIFGFTLSIFGATGDNPLGIRLIGPIAGAATILGFIIFKLGYTLPEKVK